MEISTPAVVIPKPFNISMVTEAFHLLVKQ